MDILPFWLLAYVVTGSICTTIALRERFELSDQCLWNYTLKSKNNTDIYNVEIRNLGHDCSSLYKAISSEKISRGPSTFLNTRLEHTEIPGLQRINVSWILERNTQEYLLTLKLKRRENNFTIDDTLCIYARVQQIQANLQEYYKAFFDCIEVKTGTIDAALEILLHKRGTGKPEFNFDRTNASVYFKKKPELYIENLEAHCCPQQLPILRIFQVNECTWFLSARSHGLSGTSYVVNTANGLQIKRGIMSLSKSSSLFVKRLIMDHGDIVRISVSFWCSFDPYASERDYVCSTVQDVINASLCNIPKTIISITAAETKTPEQDNFHPLAAISISLGCVTLVIVTTLIVFFYKQGYCRSDSASSDVSRNNAERRTEADDSIPHVADPMLPTLSFTTDISEKTM